MWARNNSDHPRRVTSVCSFYFVRHGQTDWGPDDILKGPQDLALNAVGLQQACEAGRVLKNILSDSSNANMVSSSLRRALETANEIEKVTGISISTQADGLKERYYGDYRLVSDPSEIPSDAETTKEFQERVQEALFKILSKYKQAHPLIIVSHQKVFEYVAELLAKRSEKLSQGGVAHFILKESETWELKIFNIKEKFEYSTDKQVEQKNEITISEKFPTLFMTNLFPKAKAQNKLKSNQHSTHKRSYSCGW